MTYPKNICPPPLLIKHILTVYPFSLSTTCRMTNCEEMPVRGARGASLPLHARKGTGRSPTTDEATTFIIIILFYHKTSKSTNPVRTRFWQLDPDRKIAKSTDLVAWLTPSCFPV